MSELLTRTVYMPGHEPMVTIDYEPTDTDIRHMTRCNELGAESRENGSTPCGAVLIHPPSEGYWEDINTEFSEGDTLGHPDIGVYRQFRRDRPKLGLDMSDCVMYSNVETCIGCSYFVVKKPRLGMLVLGIFYDESEGFFRNSETAPEKPQMNDVLRTSRHPHTVVSGLLFDEAKKLFVPENNVHHTITSTQD